MNFQRFNKEIMKIAFVVNRFPELSETFILNQIIGLLDLGHDVRIFAKPVPVEGKTHPVVKEYKLMKRVRYRPVVPSKKTICRLKALGMIAAVFVRRPVRTLQTLKLLISREEGFSYKLLFFVLQILCYDFDIIHCHFGPNGILGLNLKKIIPKIKLVTTFHGYDINSYPNRAGKDVYNDLFEYGDLFTANTSFTKQQVVSLGCNKKDIKILPVGVELEKFCFCERMLLPDEPLRILSVGRLVEKKGHEYTLRAVAKLCYEGRNIICTVIGGGPLKNELQSLVEELGIEKNIKFQGALSQDEVIEHYKKSHIFVLASITARDGDREGQGLVLQEAQAMGLPVVSTLHNGIPEGVLDGKSGFLVPEKDVDALAERLEYLINHPDIWPQMGRAGREYVEKNYNIKDLNQRLVRIYQELLEQKD